MVLSLAVSRCKYWTITGVLRSTLTLYSNISQRSAGPFVQIDAAVEVEEATLAEVGALKKWTCGVPLLFSYTLLC